MKAKPAGGVIAWGYVNVNTSGVCVPFGPRGMRPTTGAQLCASVAVGMSMPLGKRVSRQADGYTDQGRSKNIQRILKIPKKGETLKAY